MSVRGNEFSIVCPRPKVMESTVTVIDEDTGKEISGISSRRQHFIGESRFMGAPKSAPKTEIYSRYEFIISKFAQTQSLYLSTVQQLTINLSSLYEADHIPLHIGSIYRWFPNIRRVVLVADYLWNNEGERAIQGYLEMNYKTLQTPSGSIKELILRSNGDDVWECRVTCCSLFMDMIAGLYKKFHRD